MAKKPAIPPIGPTEQEMLNERFREAFRALTERGEVVKSGHAGKGIKAFAKSIGTDGHIVANILNKEGRNITYEQAHNLRKLYGISGHFLFMGQGPVFGLQIEPGTRPMNAEPVSPTGRENILYVNLPAAASPSVAIALREKMVPFNLPGYEGESFAFRVEGRSMEPTLHQGDKVICQEIADAGQIRDGQLYTVLTRDGLMVKRVHRLLDPAGKKVLGLRLESDNSVDFPPFEVEVDQETTLFKVVLKVSGLE